MAIDMLDAATQIFILHGLILEIPNYILTPDLKMAFDRGYYEIVEISSLSKMMRPGDRVLELGAGVGLISAFIMKKLKADSITTVEADERLLPIITRTHELNGTFATLVHGVASRRDGPAEFYRNPSFWTSSSLPSSDSVRSTLPGLDVQRLVRAVRPDVIVVDIEGGERTLFDRIELPGVRGLVVEMHPGLIGDEGVRRCVASLLQAGFSRDDSGTIGSVVAFSRFESRRRGRVGRERS